MPTKVHFCWCGTFPGEQDRWKVHETPSEVADDPNAQVYYWGAGQCLNQIKTTIPKGPRTIKWRDVTIRSHVLGECTQKDLPWVDDFLDTVKFLVKENLFIMVKDLVSLMVLQRSGGFFMDTTMKVAPNTNDFKLKFQVPKDLTPHSLKHALKNPPSGFMMPVVCKPQGLSIIGMSDDMTPQTLVLPGMGPRDVPEIEVWCMYAPERSARGTKTPKNVTLALDEAIERYIRRIKLLRVALEGGERDRLRGILKTDQQVKSFEDDALEVRGRGGAYKPYVGAQITGAIYDGLLATGHIGRNEQFTQQSKLPSWAWGAFQAKVIPQNAPAPYALPKVGVIKRYGGSWY